MFKAFTDITDSPTFDENVSLVTGLLYNSTSKTWIFSNSAVYTQPVANPPVFSEFASIPSITNSSQLTRLATYADEKPTPPL